MADHYYSKTPTTNHDRHSIEANIRGIKLRLTTDAGVFSKSGVDYGSRVLLENVEISLHAAVLDVGCGYGPIGLTLAKLVPSAHVTMIDVNERAVQLAQENARVNGVSNVAILQSDIYENVRNQKFDAIVTNPPIRAGKAVVHRILEEGAALLKPGGSIWVVIQKKQGAPSAEAKLEEVFGNVEEVTKDKGYRILRAVLEEK
ncbi:16S rRNA (guanine1207-N2)-methyltransferase [Paenibacillus phyllosphaerae]|uniref:16S rRNA (Guanine1207-N2)-methyltransferase n=1 Tax=Paenibacillus phyllosphaerae TaxID=274593 RepID=A0A7W5B4Z2_9BACL|nr:16S rRNA (guanine1207-N2)-methyltransferase [Paenibacillus phyllosphaerae]